MHQVRDVIEGKIQTPEMVDHIDGRALLAAVIAVAGFLVDACGFQDSLFMVDPERSFADAVQFGHPTDTAFLHRRSPLPNGMGSVRIAHAVRSVRLSASESDCAPSLPRVRSLAAPILS